VLAGAYGGRREMESVQRQIAQRTMQQQQPFLSSCLHDQLQCVSVSGMASACGISRPAAARELQIFYDNAMQDDSTKKTYRVTCCLTSVETIHGFDTTIRAVAKSDEHDEITTAVDVAVPESIPSTVFSLKAKSVSTRTSKDDDDDDTRKGANVKHQSGDGGAVETCIYALALVQPDHDGEGITGTTESLLTAHERYLAQQRDQLVTKTFMDHSLNDEEAFIVPSNEVARQLETLPPPTLRWWEANESNNSIGSSRLAQLPNKKKGAAAVVPTTAASFLASNKATSKKVSEDEKENTAAKKVGMMAASQTSTSQNKQHGSNRPTAVSKPAAAAVASSSSNKALTLSSQSSTGSGTLSTNPSKGVGNADDFVGDMEEDEDESVPDSKTASPMNVDEDDDILPDVAKQRPARQAATKQPKPQRAILDDDEVMVMDQEEHPRRQPAKKPRSKVVACVDAGAMDAYTTQRRTVSSQSSATATASSTGPQQRRRQKQWVEKTTLDANGYLRTESQEVWVDVPNDDESPAAPAAAPAALVPKPPTKKAVSGKTKKPAMKQGNLMGFFQKK
jgi:DNA polymerase subunit Cdc27